MKTVSIVIPTFNRANLLSRAIESAINQTYPCEVVVCDHGSTDNTPDVVLKYKDKIRYIRREEDNGPIVCWRDGIEHATGEIIHLNYDDDWIDADFIKKTLLYLHDDVGFVYTDAMIHYINNEITHTSFRHPKGERCAGDIIHHLMKIPSVISPGCAILRRKDSLKNLLTEIPGASGVYGKNSGVGEDLLILLLTAAEYPKYAFVAEPLAHFLAHSGSITVTSETKKQKQMLYNSYSNARRYFVDQHSWSTNILKDICFYFKWNYNAGILVEETLKLVEKKTWKPLKNLIRGKYKF